MPGLEQRVQDIVRLRRAQRRRPDGDVATVCERLVREAGPTVGRAAAARLLGVSQTALDRWIAQGEVPAVPTPAGRREVPLETVLDLLGAIEELPDAPAHRHPLAAVLRTRRGSAALDITALLPTDDAPARGHRGAELRSLVYHRAVGERLDDRVVEDALARTRRWRAEGRMHPRYAGTWETLLTGPRAQLAQTIGEDHDEAATLRQSSPFAGVLDERTRRQILDAVAVATR